MMRYELVKDKENPSMLTLTAVEGIREWKIVESNYKMIMDWLKSNLEFKEARLEQMRNRMDNVEIHKTRSQYISSLVDEARMSAISKSEYTFKLLDCEFLVKELN